MRAPELLRASLLDALALVLPVECAGCGQPDRSLCDTCRGVLVPRPRVVPVAGVGKVVVAASYDGALRGALLAFKTGATPLASALAPLLGAAVQHVGVPRESPIEWCAVPSTRAAYRSRGFHPVRVLMHRIGLHDAAVLRPAARHADQKELGRNERLRNLRGVHRARTSLEGRRFVIVDDVVTTGATLRAVADAVEAAGGHVISAVALAATERTGRAVEPHGRHPAPKG